MSGATIGSFLEKQLQEVQTLAVVESGNIKLMQGGASNVLWLKKKWKYKKIKTTVSLRSVPLNVVLN